MWCSWQCVYVRVFISDVPHACSLTTCVDAIVFVLWGDLQVPDAKKQDVSRAVKLSMITPGGTLTSASAPLELELQLQPLKPFETSVQLIINKASGGRYVCSGWHCHREPALCVCVFPRVFSAWLTTNAGFLV